MDPRIPVVAAHAHIIKTSENTPTNLLMQLLDEFVRLFAHQRLLGPGQILIVGGVNEIEGVEDFRERQIHGQIDGWEAEHFGGWGEHHVI